MVHDYKRMLLDVLIYANNNLSEIDGEDEATEKAIAVIKDPNFFCGRWETDMSKVPRDEGARFMVQIKGHICQAKWAPRFSPDHYGESHAGIYLYAYDCRGDEATAWTNLSEPAKEKD